MFSFYLASSNLAAIFPVSTHFKSTILNVEDNESKHKKDSISSI